MSYSNRYLLRSKLLFKQYKKCNIIIKNYQKRQFIVNNNNLKYYSNHQHINQSFIKRYYSQQPNNNNTNDIESEQSKIKPESESESEKQTEINDDELPSVPTAGRSLFREAVLAGIVTIIGLFLLNIYKKKRDNYNDSTLNEIYSIKSHIQYSLNTNNIDTKIYHLNEAEKHCRLALKELGGGYLSNNNNNDNDNDNDVVQYNPSIISLHIQLGSICYLLNKYQSSIDNYLVVLRALTTEFGYNSLELIQPCRQISDCYMNLNQYKMSELFLERALSVIKNNNMDEYQHNEYAPICQQMAVLLRKQYKWNESIKYTNLAIKGAKLLFGNNHIQIAHMLLDKSCCEMELKQWENAEKSARKSLKIIEFGTNKYTTANEKKQYFVDNNNDNQINQNNQSLSLSSVGISSFEQLIAMKCSILFVIGQSLIEQNKLIEANLIFENALKYSYQLDDTSKQLLILDQLRDIKIIQKQQQDLENEL